jgi:hypothetical protein
MAALFLAGCLRSEAPLYDSTSGFLAGGAEPSLGSLKDGWTASIATAPEAKPKRAPQRRPVAEDRSAKVEPDAALTDCGNSQACLSELRALLADPVRAWVGKPQPPRVYANGVRLFAYRALRTKLSCVELHTALAEMEAAGRTLSGEVSGLNAGELSRIRTLNTEVEGELRVERARRCKA